MPNTQDYDRYVDLVCEGGGVKGIGLAGAYAALEEHGYKPQNVAGTSAGAITAALIAAGYTLGGARQDHLRARLQPASRTRPGRTASRSSERR